jgi:hypothetical protein
MVILSPGGGLYQTLIYIAGSLSIDTAKHPGDMPAGGRDENGREKRVDDNEYPDYDPFTRPFNKFLSAFSSLLQTRVSLTGVFIA